MFSNSARWAEGRKREEVRESARSVDVAVAALEEGREGKDLESVVVVVVAEHIAAISSVGSRVIVCLDGCSINISPIDDELRREETTDIACTMP